MATLRKKRVSKKLKVSWRKHVNIDDVEEFLEDKRLEERLGPIESKSDNELFKLDTQIETRLSAKERKKLKALKPLKCYHALEPHTKVPDPIAKRNRVRTKEERKNELIKKKEIANREKGILKAKEIQSMQDKKLYEIKKRNKPKKGDFNTDIWSEGSKFEIENDEWATTLTKKHNLKGVGALQKTTAKSLSKKKSLHPSIEAPHPGMSYNPSYEDHQDLLRMVADKETQYIKKEEYLTRVTRGMFNKVTPGKRDQMWMVEMSEGLPDKTSAEDNEASDNEYSAVNPPVKNKKKSVQQRRKQKEQRELELKRRVTKIEKKKIADIHQVKILKKQIDRSDKRQAVVKEKRIKRAAHKALEPNRLSSTKFEEQGLEFNLGEDIAGNLRNLKKEGSILADRFRNMQKRNILEPSIKRHRKNAKIKRYTKPGHKDDWKKTVAK
ncbi:unnamed protein product [Brassicogethes aeneus]|uniref:Ribosome biogenesis protein NOP53 n=1 Tax=Brassicogethes aeneus TaxID=1431903 RepID=A0A9P0BB25_BRAAE|nr:unnamed protein product [Brassicogethes aeneus]